MPVSRRWTLFVCPTCGLVDHRMTGGHMTPPDERNFARVCSGGDMEPVEVVPAAEVERLREENKRLREALAYIAGWDADLFPEDGWRMEAAARDALAEVAGA